MKKLAEISGCDYCAHYAGGGRCELVQRVMTDKEWRNKNTDIPKWCPLPDAPETKEEKKP